MFLSDIKGLVVDKVQLRNKPCGRIVARDHIKSLVFTYQYYECSLGGKHVTYADLWVSCLSLQNIASHSCDSDIYYLEPPKTKKTVTGQSHIPVSRLNLRSQVREPKRQAGQSPWMERESQAISHILKYSSLQGFASTQTESSRAHSWKYGSPKM